jgi:adenylate kinase family enzyme
MIIFINGSINSGKSTVSKILVDKLGNTALLEIDHLRNFIEWMPFEQAIPISLENAIAVIKVFISRGLNVVIPYPLSKNNYEYFLKKLKGSDTKIEIFTLSPKVEVVLAKRGSRSLTDWEKERIKYHYTIGIPNPDFGIIIDNSDETPEQTAELIFRKLA